VRTEEKGGEGEGERQAGEWGERTRPNLAADGGADEALEVADDVLAAALGLLGGVPTRVRMSIPRSRSWWI
jgi:hypothetical protein